MDCNNYSYINYNNNDVTICEDPERMIYFEKCCNWFGEKSFFINSVLDDSICKDFEITDFSGAVAYYNSVAGPNYQYKAG